MLRVLRHRITHRTRAMVQFWQEMQTVPDAVEVNGKIPADSVVNFHGMTLWDDVITYLFPLIRTNDLNSGLGILALIQTMLLATALNLAQ